jgi:hypothetical protein
MKYTVRCTCTLSCMINDVYTYQGVPCIMSLIMADYWTGHPMSSIMLWDVIKGTSPYIQCMHVCVCAWTCPDTYVRALPVESPHSEILVFRILTSHNCCIFLNLSWLVPVHQDETIWLADYSAPVKLCVSLSDVDCFHAPQIKCTSRSTVLHFVEALDS